MNKQITDSQYSTLIGVIARVPIEEARRLVLEKIEAALPKAGKVTDARLLESINLALGSIPPARWQIDEQGVRPDAVDCLHLPLAQVAQLYQRCLKPPTWVWPPLTQEQLQARAAEAEKFAAMTHEEKAEAGGRFIYGENWERVKAEEAAREEELKLKEMEFGARPPPVDPSPPPRVKQICGSVNRAEAPTMDDLRRARTEPDDDERMTQAIAKQLERDRLLRRRLAGKPKVFFR